MFAAMTVTSFLLLNETSKAAVATWLKGGHAQEWANIFTSLFDALFGTFHLTIAAVFNTFWRSAIASLLAVSLIWWLMGGTNLLGTRSAENLPLFSLITIAIVVNVFVDYISLQQTRWFLNFLPRLPMIFHPIILLVDFFVTGALIWGALWTWQRLGWHTGETAVLGEVAGGFSMLTVFSTQLF